LRISPSYFGTLLRQHEDVRHRRITQTGVLPPAPPGFRYEDVLGLPSASGFLPLEQAAEWMSMTVEEVMEMVRWGLLEADEYGNVHPAIVAVMGVQAR
jgi:hypothetical protein